MDIKEAATHAVQSTGTITYVSASGAVLFGLSASELAAYTGAIVAVLTFIANQFWQYRAYKLKEHEHEHSEHCQ